MKDAVQKVAVATRTITTKLNAGSILALFLGAMIFITPHVNATGHLCGRAHDRCDTQKRIPDNDCRTIADNQVCAPEEAGYGQAARDGYEYLKRRTR